MVGGPLLTRVGNTHNLPGDHRGVPDSFVVDPLESRCSPRNEMTPTAYPETTGGA